MGLNTEASQRLYKKARRLIPGGTQLLSKRPEMFAPEVWPAYFSTAKGCQVGDIDGNQYYDMSTNGIGSCLLGYADPDVTEAVIQRIRDGSMSTLNPPEEVELSERLCQIHPWAQQVRLARSGGEVAAIAVRTARATTKRSKIAVCGYHGWHDWYLAANLFGDDALDGHLLAGLNPTGVPKALGGTTFTFRYNQTEQLEEIVKKHGDDLAAVVMEPTRTTDPENDFLVRVKELTQKCGALLVFDEITIGWRLCYGGAHLKYRVAPDMAIFAKALGNGHPIAAVIGTEKAMEGANQSFISSTYWTESVGPVAALAVLNKMEKTDVVSHIERIGKTVIDAWKAAAQKYALNITVCEHRPCITRFSFNHPQANILRTIYTKLMLDRGFLANPSIYPTLAHNDENTALYAVAIDDVFAEIAAICKNGQADQYLDTPEAHTGFTRLSS